jgi:hypothetical protein
MTANIKTAEQKAEKTRFLDRLNRLSLRNKIIGIAVLVLLVLLVVSIPGDRSQLIARQERVDAAQVAYDLALPAVGPIMESVNVFFDGIDVDLSDNRSYTRLSSTLLAFNRDNATAAGRFQAVVTFSENVHSLMDGDNAIPELNTVEFRTLVSNMDVTLSVAWLALMELNTAVDEYNGYHNWISANLAGALFGQPQSYTDPVSPRSSLNRSTSLEMEQ